MRNSKPQQVQDILLNLVNEVSSIRAGKTFTPTDYTNEALTALQELVEGCIGEDEPGPGEHELFKDDVNQLQMYGYGNKVRAEIRNNFRSIGLLK